MKRSTKTRLLALAALAIAMGLCAVLLPLKEYLQRFLEWAGDLGPWGPVLLAAAYVPACVLFVPGSVLTVGAGLAFGVVTGTVAVSAGSVAGASLAFILGRTLARGWVEGMIAGNAKFRAIDRAVARQGFKIVLLTRLSPIFPFNLLNYAFGLTRVSFRDYVLASWIGMLPGTVLYVYLGSLLTNLAEIFSEKGVKGGAGEQALFYVGLAIAALLTVYVTRIARKALGEVW